ncbi:acyltransferase [Pedobacter sp. UBA4863]|uniref:acyltransferase family protein n=1 Tax=Pedobacter sp. UBA4863 TaxID=1947060 RepID=UPI0025E5A066|nr:acyltransferase [Pedobacter sp. UBA4863]
MTDKPLAVRPYFPNLDILRFIAAFFVLFGHCVTAGLDYLSLPYPFKNVASLICNGSNWVSLFFVLSGFLLGYLATTDKMRNEFSFKKFMIRRALRIWPLYFLFVFIGYFVVPLIVKLFLGKIYTYTTLPYFMLFLGNFAMKQMYELNDFTLIPGNTSILWSISIEEQFYIVLGLALLVCSVKKIKWLLLGLALSGIVYILMAKNRGSAFSFHTFYYLLDFFAGALLGYVFLQKRNWLDKLRDKNKLLGFILIAALLFIVLVQHLFSIKIILVFWFVLLIFYLVFYDINITSGLKKAEWLNYGGKLSYGIYVIHPVFQYAFYLLIGKYLSGFGQFNKDMLTLLLTSVFTFYFAHLSYKYFESYFLRLKNKFY